MSEADLVLLWLVPIAFLGALIFGLTGFGAALVTIPLASQIVPLPFAIAAFTLLDCVNALHVGLDRPRDAVKAEVARMAPMILIGIALGVTLLVNLPRKAGMIALGVFVLAYAIYALVRRPGAAIVRAGWAYLAGFAGGVTGTVFGAGGPPYAIYLSHRALGKEQFRATLGLTTVFSIGMRVAAFVAAGLLSSPRIWIAAALALPASMLGLSVASRVFHRFSRDTLARAVAVMLLASGVSLLIRALS